MKANLPSNSNKDKRRRIRTYLRAYTHWKNLHEFFVALLFETGAPPCKLQGNHLFSMNNWKLGTEWTALLEWRGECYRSLKVHLPEYNDPTHVFREYCLWIMKQQEKNHISRP